MRSFLKLASNIVATTMKKCHIKMFCSFFSISFTSTGIGFDICVYKSKWFGRWLLCTRLRVIKLSNEKVMRSPWIATFETTLVVHRDNQYLCWWNSTARPFRNGHHIYKYIQYTRHGLKNDFIHSIALPIVLLVLLGYLSTPLQNKSMNIIQLVIRTNNNILFVFMLKTTIERSVWVGFFYGPIQLILVWLTCRPFFMLKKRAIPILYYETH